MTQDTRTDVTTEHEPPQPASTTGVWNGLDYTATSGWTVLRKKDKPLAELFATSYVVTGSETERPVTFVFNGGPGAASVFLHLGAIGPQRVDLRDDGSAASAPMRLVDNEDSWLGLTDLVFIDPIGTGFSRLIASDDKDADPNEYYTITRDLESMGEFMSRWLSEHGRWGSPVFIAGESYGGYRVGRLTRTVQEQTGILLSGSILISPALEPAHLANVIGGWGDYEIAPWIDLLPSQAATAAFHGRSRVFAAGTPVTEVLRAAEEFATGDYATFLARGVSMDSDERDRVLGRLADFLGLDLALVTRAEGRIRSPMFCRELLRDEGKVVGGYDGTITSIDPFSDREPFQGVDPSISTAVVLFTAAINDHLRGGIGVETDRDYAVLNSEVTLAWKNDEAFHYVQPTAGAVDDFRYGMVLNPHMKAFITHGWYDLMTPYYASERMFNLMRLDPSVADRITRRHFHGGHMFYTWRESRAALTAAITDFIRDAAPTPAKKS